VGAHVDSGDTEITEKRFKPHGATEKRSNGAKIRHRGTEAPRSFSLGWSTRRQRPPFAPLLCSSVLFEPFLRILR
jgi:hypothetical protein